jgi:hypothetical protein
MSRLTPVEAQQLHILIVQQSGCKHEPLWRERSGFYALWFCDGCKLAHEQLAEDE